MVTTKRSEPPPPLKKKKTCHIHSEGYNTKHVDSFKYLGHFKIPGVIYNRDIFVTNVTDKMLQILC